MSITPDDLIALAKELENLNQEVAWRSCASRAYYGAFHTARALAPDDVRNNKRDAHEKLISWLTAHGKNNWLTVVGGLLQDIRDKRTKADYKISEGFAKGNAGIAVHLAEKMCKIISDSSNQSGPNSGRAREDPSN